MKYAGASDIYRPDNVSAYEYGTRLIPYAYTDFLNAGTTTQGAFVGFAVAGGTNNIFPAAGVVTKDHPGVWGLQSSTTASSGFGVSSGVAGIRIGGAEVFSFVFRTPPAFTTFNLRAGFMDSTGAGAVVDGLYFNIANTGQVTANNMGNSIIATSVLFTAVVNAWYHFRITVNATGSSVLYEVYNDTGTLMGSASIVSQIPTAVGRETGCGFVALSTGTTVVDLGYVDYIEFSSNMARSRGAKIGE